MIEQEYASDWPPATDSAGRLYSLDERIRVAVKHLPREHEGAYAIVALRMVNDELATIVETSNIDPVIHPDQLENFYSYLRFHERTK